MNVKFGCSSFKTAVRLSNQICSKRSGDHILLPTCAIFLQTRYKTTSEWKRLYDEKKKAAYDLNASTANSMNPNGVFANNETDLNTIEVYGFDYDYTLACYKPELHELIYDLGITELVHKYQYPEGILKELKYTKDFAVRGLHYDIARGFLLKLDSFHNIQLGTVYRGLSPLEDVEVKSHYFGTHVPFQDMSTFYGTGPMYQLVDLFAVPEILLLASITEYFINNNIPYDPEYVFYDIRTAVQGIHSTSLLHKTIMQNLEKYLEKADSLKEFLTRLKKSDRKIFLITNSSFPFVDAGMKYMMGDDWEHLFDVIICKARKPKFFNESTRPFRRYDKGNNMETWDRVSSLVKGRVYQEGNINFFKQMTDFHGARVLYFGDHVYSDLADPALKLGWKTGAIIPELETEIEKGNSADFQAAVRWLCDLQLLIENAHVEKNPETIELVQEWLKEREKIREYTKGVFNPRFGSMFRTHHNPTYFTRRLARFADIYTSRLINLLEYPVDHTFYPRRMALPHEPNLTSSLWV